MEYLHALILSIIEGITEFLPISSTGHLILAADLLNIPTTEFWKSFQIFIQLGAILAVVVLYWKRLMSDLHLWKITAIAFVPTAILGLIFYKLIKEFLLGNTIVTLLALFIGGIALIILELSFRGKVQHIQKIEHITFGRAFLIGVAQSFSMIPGVSRSAATIIGSSLLGLERKIGVEFSFILAIPTMLAATGLDLIKSSSSFSGEQYGLLAVGFVGAFFTALFAIKFFLRIIEKRTFIGFGVYRIIVALLFWVFIVMQ